MDIEDGDRKPRAGMVVGGIVIVLVGVMLMLDRLGIGESRFAGHYWPLILIAIGVTKMLDAPVTDRRGRPRRSGLGLVMIGTWLLVSELHLFGLDYRTSWPLMVIVAGMLIIWRALDRDARCARRMREN